MIPIRLMALDTATEYGSVAINHNGKIISHVEHCQNQHAAQILGMIEALLVQADLKLSDMDAIAFGCGPGSFTGVRIAVSIAQGLAYGIQKPVIPISTLQIMAQQAYQQYGVTHALVALDARMQQIYSGLYGVDANGLMQPYSEPSLLSPEDFILAADLFSQQQGMIASDWCGIGNGWQMYNEILQAQTFLPTQIYPDVAPFASAALMLAEDAFKRGVFIHAEQAEPIYLRNDVARKSGK